MRSRLEIRFLFSIKGLFGKWKIEVDGRGLKGILGDFLIMKFPPPQYPPLPLQSTNSQTSLRE
jgi:hypothetical protein